MFYSWILKPLLFCLNPEKAHHLTMKSMNIAGKFNIIASALRFFYGSGKHGSLEVQLGGIKYLNPVGLAAGLDKNGVAVRAFSAIGFGFLEVGTVTPKPQLGNELPRLFRLPSDQALINRMGFNNVGSLQMRANLKQAGKQKIPIAVNIGKNKATSNEQALDDYVACIRQLYEYGDFFVVNISSPNTPQLRNLQHGDELSKLLSAIKIEMEQQSKLHDGTTKPVWVKIAPDVTDTELEQMVATIAASGMFGIIATNTTLSRQGLTHRNAGESGGLSGRPLLQRSTEVIRRIYKQTNGKLPIIGSGGISTAEEAYDKIRAGASLVEVYTALIYEGPGLIKQINRGLLRLMARDGFTHISQAVGVDCCDAR